MTEQGGDTPLIPQPSHGSILQRAAALARTMAFENTNDPMGETQEFNPLETAPGLEQVTQQLMDEYEMPESIWMILDSEEIYLAGRALELLPRSNWQHSRRHWKRRTWNRRNWNRTPWMKMRNDQPARHPEVSLLRRMGGTVPYDSSLENPAPQPGRHNRQHQHSLPVVPTPVRHR